MKKMLVILGPTATGKSALAVKLARRFDGEIISADSRQVYRGLNLGTGKITRKEMQGVPHHLLDVMSPKKQYTVSDFKKLAEKKLDGIASRGKLPLIVGGTGLYIDTVVGKISIPDVPPNPELRKRLEKKPPAELFALLQKLDPWRAKTIDPHNPRRLIRAIEIAKALGSVRPRLTGKARPYGKRTITESRQRGQLLWIGLNLPPEELRKKIERRLQERIEKGLIQEVKRLHEKGLTWKRMEELGLEYRFVSRHLRGEITKEELLEQLTREIWHYAKRQMTWFKRNKEIVWFHPKDARRIYAHVKKTSHSMCSYPFAKSPVRKHGDGSERRRGSGKQLGVSPWRRAGFVPI